MYKIYYKDKDANYPAFETGEKALDFFVKQVSEATGETREEILAEEWTSPTGIKECVEVREIKETLKQEEKGE